MGLLDGKVIAITGASSGIGEATAVAAVREGAKVDVAARREERLRELAKRLEGEGGEVLVHPCDVSVEEQSHSFIEATTGRFGRLDGLVNNAGLMLLGPIVGADTEEWRRMVAVNVFGVLYCTHAALPVMVEQGYGDLIAISSVAGRSARAGAGVYNLTKFGIGAFYESLRQELADTDIRVCLIEPGAVATELLSHNRPEIQQQMAQGILSGVKPLAAQDIADAILYVLSRPRNVAINELLVRPVRQQR